MAINPFRVGELQLPQPLRPVPIDFSPLQSIGEGIGQYRQQQQIGSILAGATDEAGNVDPIKAATALGAAGFGAHAQRMLDTALRQKTLEESISQHRTAQSHADAVLQETIRANQAREAAGGIHAVPNMNAGTTDLVKVGPGGYTVLAPTAPAAAGNVPPTAPRPTPTTAPPVEPDAAPTTVPPTTPTIAPTTAAPAADPISQAKAEHPEWNWAALDKLPPERAATVVGMATYKADPRTLDRTGGNRTFLVGKAAELTKGEYDQTFFPTKQQTLNAFNKGTEARTVRSVNNLVDHLETARELVDALGGSDIGLVRAAQAKFQKLTGQSAPTNIAAAAPILAGEINKVIIGMGAGGISERADAALHTLGTANGTQQARDALNTIKSFMMPQMQNLERQYEVGTKEKNFRERLSPAARKSLDQYEGKDTTSKATGPVLDKVKNSAEANALAAEAADFVAKNPGSRDAVYKRLIERDVPPAAAAAAVGMR